MNKIGKTGRCFAFFVVFLLCSAIPGMAIDFGLEIQQDLEFTNTGTKASGETNYAGGYSPWLSSDFGQTAKLYLSAKVSTIYEFGVWKGPPPGFLFEVGRSEFLWHPKLSGSHISSINIEAGRVPFQESSGLVASGLFDGFTGSLVLGQVRLNAGAFFTGLLYKETAEIVMTPDDTTDYADKDHYFASRRLLFSVGAEFPGLTPRSSLAANALFQFDLNDSVTSLNTQYLSAKYTFLVLEPLSLNGAVVLGLAEDQNSNTSTQFAFAAGVDWEVPGALRDMLQGEIRWSNGASNNRVAFAPVSGIDQGQVFSPKLSGLMTIKGKYIARFFNDFSFSAEASYFVRTDGTTQNVQWYPASPERLLGGELYGALTWAPLSDLRATVGGGFFFPGMGNVFAPSAPVWWKLSIGIVVSL
jgi:hypothetical protein